MSDPAYRGRHRPPAGRHRAARSSRTESGSGLPKFAGSGYLLPTAAAATLVLTATGAHIGSAAGGPTASAPTTSLTASGTPTQDSIERDVLERAARSDARNSALTGTDAILPSDSGRADLQKAADAADRADAVADAGAEKAAADAAASAHAWIPFIDAGYQLTSGFGMRWGAMHPGQDFAVPVGTPVKAMSSGTVIFAGWQGGYGNKVEIQYWDGTVSWFCHNSKLLVKQGENVTPGEVVSMSGNTGHSTGPHVHVEIHPNDANPVPPIPWLTKMGAMP